MADFHSSLIYHFCYLPVREQICEVSAHTEDDISLVVPPLERVGLGHRERSDWSTGFLLNHLSLFLQHNPIEPSLASHALITRSRKSLEEDTGIYFYHTVLSVYLDLYFNYLQIAVKYSVGLQI